MHDRFAGAVVAEVACWMQTGERQSGRIRVRYLQSALSQDVGYFDTNVNTAEIVGHTAQDISLVQDVISEKVRGMAAHADLNNRGDPAKNHELMALVNNTSI